MGSKETGQFAADRVKSTHQKGLEHDSAGSHAFFYHIAQATDARKLSRVAKTGHGRLFLRLLLFGLQRCPNDLVETPWHVCVSSKSPQHTRQADRIP